jgi:murein DD-endopeptidase MepM/ murein hydrolase activator NlpD
MADYRDRNVFAVRGGVVDRIGWEDPNDEKRGYGYRVYIRRPDGRQDMYAHMEPGSVRYRVGESIVPGIHLGRYADPTNGTSTGPHLHFAEIDEAGNWIDPGDAMPVTNGKVTSKHGMRTHPKTGLSTMHRGIDIEGPARPGGFDISFP